MNLPNENQVHVWQADLNQTDAVGYFTSLLSEDELQRAAQLVFPIHRERFIVGRGILRCILARYLKSNPKDLLFTYGEYGKPSLRFPETKLQFNVSHTDQLALYAISATQPVGVDIEAINNRVDAESIAQRYFTSNEYNELQNLPNEQRLLGFFHVWTRKEALIKAIGAGLFTDLKQLELGLTTTQVYHPLGLHKTAEQNISWSLINLNVPPANVATLAVIGKAEVIYQSWQLNREN